jgi:hypothetical protein
MTINIMKNKFVINLALVSSSLYVSFQIIANVLSTKITVLPFFHLAVDGGTIIYPLTFTLRDFVHKTWGKNNARQVVIIAALMNVLAVLLFFAIGKMQPDASWAFQSEYEKILMPVARITFASIIAQVISELIDTEIFSLVYHKWSDVLGVLFSNGVALIIDSIIFSLIAFLGVLPFSAVLEIIVANILIKALMSLVVAPTIRLVPRTVKFSDI